MALRFRPVKFIKPWEDSSLHRLECSNTSNRPTNSSDDVKDFYKNLVVASEPSVAEQTSPEPNVSKKSKVVIKRRRSVRQNWSEKKKYTVNDLLKAAESGDISTIQDCLAAGVAVNCTDFFSWTPLMCAAFAGQTSAVEYLLSIPEIDVNVINSNGKTASDLARSNAIFDIIRMISVRNVEAEDEPTTSSELTSEWTEKRFCNECQCEIQDSAHFTSTVHLMKTSASSADITSFVLPVSNRGYQLMVKEGWNQRSGLGQDEKGRKYPIKTILKRDRRCLGAKLDEKPKVTHFAPFDVSAIKPCRRTDKKDDRINEKRTVKKHLRHRYSKDKEMEINFRRQFY